MHADFIIENGVLVKYTGAGGDVVIPEGVTAVREDAFPICPECTELYWPNSLTNIAYTLWRFPNLQNIHIAADHPIYMEMDGTMYNKRLMSLVSCPMGRKGCFCIPDGITALDYYAFAACVGLEEIRIPTSLADIGLHAFCGCERLKALQIDADNPKYRFENGLLLSKDGKTLEMCMPSMEGPCILPDGLKKIEAYAFEGCCRVTEILVPDSVTSIASRAFENCTALTRLVLPAGQKKVAKEICRNAQSLREIVFSKNTEVIGKQAFDHCGIEELVLPEKVKKVEATAFRDCPLRKVTVLADHFECGRGAFGEAVDDLELIADAIDPVELPAALQAAGLRGFVRRYLQGDGLSDNCRKNYLKYIKSRKKRLAADTGCLQILMREKLLTAKDLLEIMKREDLQQMPELMSMLLEYRNTQFSQKEIDKAALGKL